MTEAGYQYEENNIVGCPGLSEGCGLIRMSDPIVIHGAHKILIILINLQGFIAAQSC